MCDWTSNSAHILLYYLHNWKLHLNMVHEWTRWLWVPLFVISLFHSPIQNKSLYSMGIYHKYVLIENSKQSEVIFQITIIRCMFSLTAPKYFQRNKDFSHRKIHDIFCNDRHHQDIIEELLNEQWNFQSQGFDFTIHTLSCVRFNCVRYYSSNGIYTIALDTCVLFATMLKNGEKIKKVFQVFARVLDKCR